MRKDPGEENPSGDAVRAVLQNGASHRLRDEGREPRDDAGQQGQHDGARHGQQDQQPAGGRGWRRGGERAQEPELHGEVPLHRGGVRHGRRQLGDHDHVQGHHGFHRKIQDRPG